MDLSRMQQLTKGMRDIKSDDNDDSAISVREASDLNAQGVKEYNAGNYERALELQIKAALLGNIDAMRWTGDAYRKGAGVVQDPVKAIEWYKKAAETANDAESMYHLGMMYVEKRGVKYGFDTALYWMEKSAEAGYVEAMYQTGNMYGYKWDKLNYDENGKIRDYDEIRDDLSYCSQKKEKWISKAAAAGHPKACQSSSSCFVTTAVCESFDKADDCYELTTFRNFRDSWLSSQSDGKILIAQYYDIAPKIVAKINRLPNASEIYRSIWSEYLKPCLNFIETEQNSNCKSLYVRMVQDLQHRFLK